MSRIVLTHTCFLMAAGCSGSPENRDTDGDVSSGASSDVQTTTGPTTVQTESESSTSPSSSTTGGPTCGNGILESGEACDGDPVLGVSCPDSCTFSRGTVLWNWTETSPSTDRALRAAVSESGDIFIAGNSQTESLGPFLTALDSNGKKRWDLESTRVEDGFMLAAVHSVGDRIFVQGSGTLINDNGAPEAAILRAAYRTDGSLDWHSYRLTGESSYEQIAGPIIDINNSLFFFSIEERFGNGHSPGVLNSFSLQGDPIDEVFLEAPRINRLVRVGDWTTPMMIASSSPGELYVGGSAFRSQGSDHAMLQRRTTGGTLITSALYQNPESRPARYSNAVEAPSGQVIAVGSRRTTTSVVPMIHLYSPEGEIIWESEPQAEVESSQNAHASVTMLDEHTVVVVGSRETEESGVDGWLGCVSVDTGVLEWETTIKLAPSSLWTYPQDIEVLDGRVFIIVGFGSDGDSPHNAFAQAIAL